MYPRFVNLVRLLWLVIIAWYELGTFYHHTSSCTWPDEELYRPDAPRTHVLVIADPQILDHRSYPDRPPWLMRLSQFIVDLNIRKSWRAALRRRPDAVVFLGDMMDNGRYNMSDDEFETYFRRFKSIFAANANLPIHYLPGNHDIGLGASSPKYKFSDHAVERYISHFGPLNQRITLGNHTVWMIDAPGLVDEERERMSTGLPIEQWAEARPDRTFAFVHALANSADPGSSVQDAQPILFTHVPLSRPEGASCGPLRERGTIRKGQGLGYQNLLSPQASHFLLQSIRPAIVFSGDDHDYCERVHAVLSTDTKRPSAPTMVPEITVKAFSMAMGIRRPGYQLLSLVPPSISAEDKSFAHKPCLLPDQLGIYLSVYVPLLVLTLLALLGWNIRRTTLRHTAPTNRDVESVFLSASASRDNAGLEVDYDLPPPSAWRLKEFPRHGLSRTFSLGGAGGGRSRKFTISCSSVVNALVGFLWTGGMREDEKSRRTGVLKGFIKDLRDAAWAPLLLFVLIAWSVW